MAVINNCITVVYSDTVPLPQTKKFSEQIWPGTLVLCRHAAVIPHHAAFLRRCTVLDRRFPSFTTHTPNLNSKP